MKKLLYILLVLTFISCGYEYPPGQHNSFPVVNMSRIPVYVYANNRDIVETPFFLYERNHPRLVAPGEISSSALRWDKGGTFEEYYEEVLMPQRKEYLYVFVIDAALSCDWIEDNCFSSSCYIVRYDLKLDDLSNLDWVISFPPDERMKSIHMYPTYQEVIAKYGN